MNAASYSKLGYLILKKESSPATPVYPDTPIEILSENILPNWDTTPVSPIAGNRSMNLRNAKNRVGPFVGTVEMLVEPKTIGHILCGLLGEDTHSVLAAGISEQSDFQPLNILQSYTMDLKMAGEDYITRYFGVRISKVVFSLQDNILKAAFDITAQRVFTNARLTVAHASGTVLDLDQTSGLTTSDSLQILSKSNLDTVLATLTVSSLVSELQANVSTIGASLAVDDVAVIKARTLDDEDYNLSQELIWSGGADVFFGKGANALQALGAKTNCESFELTIENGVEPRWAATGVNVVDRMPSAILAKGVTVSGKFSQFHVNPQFLDFLRQNEQLGLRFRFRGQQLQANSAAAATGVLESSGAGQVTVTADTAGEDGNDYAIKVVQGTGTLSAAISGKMITVTLDADAADNAVALVASAIDALSGVSASSSSTGNVTVADNPDKVQFSGGRDANEREMLRFDLPNVRMQPFQPNLGQDDIIQEDIEFTAYRDTNDGRELLTRLRNSITAY